MDRDSMVCVTQADGKESIHGRCFGILDCMETDYSIDGELECESDL